MAGRELHNHTGSGYHHHTHKIIESKLRMILCIMCVRRLMEQVEYGLNTHLFTFYDTNGKQILQEASRDFIPTQDMGKAAYGVKQSWYSNADESLYGLGQFQNGLIDFKHAPIQLVQVLFIYLLLLFFCMFLLFENRCDFMRI